MNHPPQRDMMYPGCFTHLAIIMVIITAVGYFVQ